MHTGDRDGFFRAFYAFIERDHSAAIDPHGEMMSLFARYITPVAVDTSAIVAIKLHTRVPCVIQADT